MGILYVARMARFDLFRVTCRLATRVTKWSKRDDKRLHKLVCYVHSSLEQRQVGFIGDSPSDCTLNLFTDADFAGDAVSQRSTSVVHLAMMGRYTQFPLQGISKKLPVGDKRRKQQSKWDSRKTSIEKQFEQVIDAWADAGASHYNI